ncbi:MAG: FAD-binding protein, partial [Candidatus Competibacteraceae bacterium]|nr:FAD-binding protein [Candidatus Competibacteraceae bacterium]
MSADLLRRNAPLHNRNSFGLPAYANWFAIIDAPAQILDLMNRPEWTSLPRFILGGGSNLVLTGDFAGLILQVCIPGRERIAEDADAWFVRVGAGEKWHDFVCWTLAQGWPGLENLALIP